VLGSGHKIDTELFGEEVVNSINIKSGRRVTFPKLNFSEEDFAGLAALVKPEISLNYSITTS